MFCNAIAKPKVAAETPASMVIGRMNSPRLCRRPMQMEMIAPLSISSRIMARRLGNGDADEEVEAIGDLYRRWCRSAAGFHKRYFMIRGMHAMHSPFACPGGFYLASGSGRTCSL